MRDSQRCKGSGYQAGVERNGVTLEDDRDGERCAGQGDVDAVGTGPTGEAQGGEGAGVERVCRRAAPIAIRPDLDEGLTGGEFERVFILSIGPGNRSGSGLRKQRLKRPGKPGFFVPVEKVERHQ